MHSSLVQLIFVGLNQLLTGISRWDKGGMNWGREGLPSLESRVWVMGRESPRTRSSDGIATSEFRIIALAMHDRLGSRQRSLDHHRQTGLLWQDSFSHGSEDKRHSRSMCCRPANEIGKVYIWHSLNE